MRRLNLDRAVAEIARASKADPGAFFFLVGAGISAPEVPLSKWISDDCRRRAAEQSTERELELAPGMDAYSYWFERAFPQPIQRQRYLRDLLHNTRISAAALRLAHVLANGSVSQLVITPNFDESIERALKLFSVPSLVCDHPATAERIDPRRRDVQVVHIHGTYWYYDCCNLNGEIADRAAPSSQTLTMQSLIDRTLATSSPIVIGYAGWASDVFMTSLRRRLSSRLPYNLYWFCYSEGDLSNLPLWLLDHQDVVIVSPGTNSRDESDDEEEYAAEPGLAATQVLDSLIRHMNLDPPLAITRPIAHLIHQFEAQLPSAGDDAEGSDIYQIGSVLAALRASEAKYTIGDAELERAEDALKRADYGRAISIALEHISEGPNGRKFASILAAAVTRHRGDPEARSASFAQALEALRPFATDRSIAVQYRSVLNSYARLLLDENRLDEAVQMADQAIALATESGSPSAMRLTVRAYNTKAAALAKSGDWESALKACDKALRLGDATGRPLDMNVVRINRGTALMRLGRPAEALVEYAAATEGVTEGSAIYWRLQGRRLEALIADDEVQAAELAASEIVSNAQAADHAPSEARDALNLARGWLASRASSASDDEMSGAPSLDVSSVR